MFLEASALLLRLDLSGIYFADNTDEYDPELGTVLLLASTLPLFAGSSVIGPEAACEERNAVAEGLWELWWMSGVRYGKRSFGPVASMIKTGFILILTKYPVSMLKSTMVLPSTRPVRFQERRGRG